MSTIEGDGKKLLETKVRVRGDIAKVLSSLRLVEKVKSTDRKPETRNTIRSRVMYKGNGELAEGIDMQTGR